MINQRKFKYLQDFNQNALVKFKHQTKFSKIPIVRERDCRRPGLNAFHASSYSYKKCFTNYFPRYQNILRIRFSRHPLLLNLTKILKALKVHSQSLIVHCCTSKFRFWVEIC